MAAPHHRPSRPQQHYYSAPSTPRRGSTSSFSSEDDITPCPLEKKQTRQTQPTRQPILASSSSSQHTSSPSRSRAPHPHHRPQRPKSWRDSQHYLSPLESTDDETDTTALWQSMLAIQREFGCYNSARMRAAVESGGEGPVRKCFTAPLPV